MWPRHYNERGKPLHGPLALYDKWLIFAVVGLVFIGLTMVASSSVVISTKNYHAPFHFFLRQIIYLLFGLSISLIIIRTESKFWEKASIPFLMLCFILLVLVLVPGVGKVVNGARRWLAFGPIGIQVSELTKFAIILYMAGYLVRQQDKLSSNILAFIKPMLVLGIFAICLLLEPDFGATVVISGIVLSMLFLTGVKLRYYIALGVIILCFLTLLAISSPYRLLRLTTFLNPWADQFNSGYQLTQSLIAFGRGGWFGVGLGDGVQKLLYLPEAHTDFLFAVLAEEAGLTGILLVLSLYSILVIRGLIIGYNAYYQERYFASYTAYGITCWLGLQAAINMGVNAGLLPTKGLTLPLMSYGGASMVVCLCVVALLLRIDHENRWMALGMK